MRGGCRGVLEAANFWREVAEELVPDDWPGRASEAWVRNMETLRDANAEAERERRSALSPEMENLAGEKGFPESDVEEFRKISDFLAARKEFRKAKEEGRLTEEMKAEYVRMIHALGE